MASKEVYVEPMTEWTCDRCGDQTTFKTGFYPLGWSKIVADPVGEWDQSPVNADLCRDCSFHLHVFLTEKK